MSARQRKTPQPVRARGESPKGNTQPNNNYTMERADVITGWNKAGYTPLLRTSLWLLAHLDTPAMAEGCRIWPLNREDIAGAVRNYNDFRGPINERLAAAPDDEEAPALISSAGGVAIGQEAWGYWLEHDEFVRVLLVNDGRPVTVELAELRPEQVTGGFGITLPEIGGAHGDH